LSNGDPGVGVGLHIKFNKRWTRTWRSTGWGAGRIGGWFLGLTEAF
jgi:hypothetical protein